MYLRKIEIKNFRSLEDVTLDGLKQFNVLIGRNNSGKSSVINAIAFLANNLVGQVYEVSQDGLLTGQDTSRSLEFRLTLEPRQPERDDFIKLISPQWPESRRDESRNSPFLSQVEFHFKTPPGQPQQLHLRETKLIDEHDQWAVVQEMEGDDSIGNPEHRFVKLDEVSKHRAGLITAVLDINAPFNQSDQGLLNARLEPAQYRDQGQFPDAVTAWPMSRLQSYLRNTFFFSPFRHSTERMSPDRDSNLRQDASNLVRVLANLLLDDQSRFRKIDEFVKAAVPAIGALHTPHANDTETRVGFRFTDMADNVRLHDMGGGIEQLLMVATALVTKGDDFTVFLEEPESHLHAGAQRFLIERLCEGDRQVFVTTHSPVFLNTSRDRAIYHFALNQHRRTEVTPADDPESLSEMLADIGARNSDVLLSDAVLFVEGPGDRDVFHSWSRALGTSLEEHNITVLPMGGGERGKAPPRSDVLAAISQKAPIPHLFVFDRDERTPSEVAKFGEHAYVLRRRELENYFLVPRALKEAIRAKLPDDRKLSDKLDATTDEEIEDIINKAAAGLKRRVLVKRVWAELLERARRRNVHGPLSSDAGDELASRDDDSDLADAIAGSMESRIKQHLDKLDIKSVVQTQQEALAKEWADKHQQRHLAPGEELVDAVFQHFGARYNKSRDAVRIAKAMHHDEIDPESVYDNYEMGHKRRSNR